MSKLAKSEVLDAATSERVDRIKGFYDNVLRSQRDANVYRFLCGTELNRQKAALPHGDFGDWCKTHLPFLSNGSAHNYMRLADSLTAKFPTLEISPERMRIGNGAPLPEKETRVINEAIFDALDGKSITQFMRDEDIIRQEKKAGGAKRKLSEEETVDAERAHAEQLVNAAIEQINLAITMPDDDISALAKVKPAKRAEFLAACVTASKFARKLKRNPKK